MINRKLLSLTSLGIATLLFSHTTIRPSYAAPNAQLALPAGFVDELVATFEPGVIPTSIATLPDGRVLVTLKAGLLHVVENGNVLPTPALDLRNDLCTSSEEGLESVAVDPEFGSNGQIYLYYTARRAGEFCQDAVNRVVRYRLNGNTAESPSVLLDNIPTPGNAHNGGNLEFGPDGLLYVSVGDGAEQLDGIGTGSANDNAPNRSLLLGKMLRITRDGGIPESNPYATTPGAVNCGESEPNKTGGWCREIFAIGLRNPFKFAFRGDGTFYINDVGQGAWEEINQGKLGADYGWNAREGNCIANTESCGGAPSGLTDPLFQYSHNGFCAITGAAFSDGSWPAPFNDAYFFGDYCSDSIFLLTQDGNGQRNQTAFAVSPSQGGLIELHFDRGTRSLYYALGPTYRDLSSPGIVRRVRFAGDGNRAPTAAISAATPRTGGVPLRVQFDSAGSVDPEGGALTYTWDFGDGSPASAEATPAHVYTTAGTFVASLTVIDEAGARSAPATVTIFAGNSAAEAAILEPAAQNTFATGDLLTLRGSATDAEDGLLPDSALSWRVVLHHVSDANRDSRHIHPFFSGVGNNLALPPMPAPEDLDAAQYSYLEIELTATDASGQSRVLTQTLMPRLSAVTYVSNPPNLWLSITGKFFYTPIIMTAWEGMPIELVAPELQVSRGGDALEFRSWSHSADPVNVVRVAPDNPTYVANYEIVPRDARFTSMRSGVPSRVLLPWVQ